MEVRKVGEELKADIICIQEPYTSKSRLINIPITAEIVIRGENSKAAIINLNRNYQIIEISQFTDEFTACAELLTGFEKNILISMYCQFQFQITSFINKLELIINTYSNQNLIITMDSSAKSPLWFSNIRNDRCRRRGEQMEVLIFGNNLVIINKDGQPPTYSNRAGATSNIDLTLTTQN